MAKPVGGRTSNGISRAPRFSIQIPLRYRPSGEIGWSEGRTENISRSGVLFEAEQIIGVETRVEISLMLPMEIAGEAGAEVVCRGQIVRTVLPPATDAPPELAARILDYRFVREQGMSVA